MYLNPYFAGDAKAAQTERQLLCDMITEGIQIYGYHCFYFPRQDGRFDSFLGEDPRPRFEKKIDIEMYLETFTGPTGAGDVFTKFGLDIQDSMTFSVSVDRWEKIVKPYHPELHRPREGDLIHIHFDNMVDHDFELFEIKWVEHEEPFNQLGRESIFQLKVEKFRYSNEIFKTGVEGVDNFGLTVGVDKSLFRLQLEDGSLLVNESGTFIVLDTPWVNDQASNRDAGGPFGDNNLIQDQVRDVTEFKVLNPFGDEF